MNFYELQEPTKWADPPSNWSSSTIDDVEACPLRWQLLHSRWGEHDSFPVRPSPAVIEGQIVHDALDRLTRAAGLRGNPAFGSAEFGAALTDADFFPGFARDVVDWQQRLTKHPRRGPHFNLRTSAEELANRAVRLFREQYKPGGRPSSRFAVRSSEAPTDLKSLLRQRRALSEVKLTHPRLPFLGVLDRVQHASDGVEIVDFKTGKPSETHRQQLLRYAHLWWRATGNAPVRIRAQYLNGIESWPVTLGALAAVGADLEKKISHLADTLRARPAIALPGAACHTCPVRARCATGWAAGHDATVANGRGDAELVVMTQAGEYGLLARSRSGAEVAVVYEPAVARQLPAHAHGQVFRILDGVWNTKHTQLQIKAWTEVFVVDPGAMR